MQTTFDTIREACLYYQNNFSPGAAFATQPTIHGVKLDFHVYVFGDLYMNGYTQPTLFSLCTSQDCATQVIICRDLSIYTGQTLTPPYRCKGLIVHCSGTFYNNRGYLKMTSRGCKATGQDLYLDRNPSNGNYEMVPARGAAGGESYKIYNVGQCISGKKGHDGINRQSGGGGSGGSRTWVYQPTIGRGGYGTSYSGGIGSGSVQSDGGYDMVRVSANASDIGGAGGRPNAGGNNTSGFSLIGLGGQGNPANYEAQGYRAGASRVWSSVYGSGGLIVIYARDFNNNGWIESKGGNMMTCDGHAGCVTSGGATGGGSINIFYGKKTYEGSISANGGGITSGGTVGIWGGYGGNGCITLIQALFLKLNKCTSNYSGKIPIAGSKVTVKAEYVNDPLGVFTGFSFDGIKESDVTYDNDSKLSFSFTMPNNSVTISANYKLYKINCTRCSCNAPKIPLPGEKYIITAPSHYIMNTSLSSTESFTAFSHSGIKEKIRVIDRLNFEFIMPIGDVNVVALFSDFIRKNTDIYKQINEHQFIDYYNIL